MNYFAPATDAPAGSQAIIYQYGGARLWVALPGPDPARQLGYWLRRQAYTNPVFARQVRSIWLLTEAPLPPAGYHALLRTLGQLGLRNQLRLRVPQPAAETRFFSAGRYPAPALLDELLAELEDGDAPAPSRQPPGRPQRIANTAALLLGLGGVGAGTLTDNKDLATVGLGPGEALLAHDKMERAVQLDAPASRPEAVPGPPPPPTVQSTGTSAYGQPPRQMPGPRKAAHGTTAAPSRGQATTTAATSPPLPARAGSGGPLAAGGRTQGRWAPAGGRVTPPRPAQARGARPRPGVSPPAPGWGRTGQPG